MPETKWKSLINLKKANEFFEDTKKMIDAIQVKSGIRRFSLFMPESGSWAIHPSEVDQK
jgi:hypothetical protein